ncbi:MAG: TlpA family protein disulfide reductase [Salinirussus sp.]
MTRLSRRALLAGAGATAASLAGCLGGGSAAAGTITLPAVDAPGSPGGEVPVRPEGEPALLDFFATWCAPCKPQMESLGQVHDMNPDFHMISITQESDRQAIKSFWADYEGRWPVAIDADLIATEKWGVQSIPTLIVVDPSGDEVWRHVGLASRDAIASAVQEAQP